MHIRYQNFSWKYIIKFPFLIQHKTKNPKSSMETLLFFQLSVLVKISLNKNRTIGIENAQNIYSIRGMHWKNPKNELNPLILPIQHQLYQWKAIWKRTLLTPCSVWTSAPYWLSCKHECNNNILPQLISKLLLQWILASMILAPFPWTHFITFFESSSTIRFCETSFFES